MKLWLTSILLTLSIFSARADSPSLTVYNDNFAVVREMIPLKLKSGINDVSFADVTAHVEPSSVILRDAKGGDSLQILEQNYRADPVSEGLLLNLFEGKTIPFQVQDKNTSTTVMGKIVRSGYVMHTEAFNRYGGEYQMQQQAMASPENSQPIIEINGQLRFGLPGTPLFPSLGDDTILKPTLNWQLESANTGDQQAELSYVTGGMSWNADYNLVLPVKGDNLELVGWVTMDNQSGKSFSDASIQLMAGEVQKIQPQMMGRKMAFAMSEVAGGPAPQVKETPFDEYHLYTLPRKTSLRDRETKQLEFIAASDIPSSFTYIYDGAKVDWANLDENNAQTDRNFGIEYNTKIQLMREFKNSEKNHLGVPLPKGDMRVYRRDDSGHLQFIGENAIDHTPRDETIRLVTGNAFDIVGQRVQTDFHADTNTQNMDETFQITLRNHKDQPVAIQVVEHLYRYSNWKITESDIPYEKLDSRTIRFTVKVPARGEQKMNYAVHYSW